MARKRHRVNYEGYITDLVHYINNHGVKLKPYPVIKLSNRSQEGVFIRTGYYEPDEKVIVLFVKDRHPKDVLRSLAHECIHHNQNLEGRLVGYKGDKITEDNELVTLEAEAYKKGNLLFRSWTEEFQRGSIPHRTFSPHMRKKIKT